MTNQGRGGVQGGINTGSATIYTWRQLSSRLTNSHAASLKDAPRFCAGLFGYCAFAQSDPVTLTATFEKKIRTGFPSALPRWSIATSSGPAFL